MDDEVGTHCNFIVYNVAPHARTFAFEQDCCLWPEVSLLHVPGSKRERERERASRHSTCLAFRFMLE